MSPKHPSWLFPAIVAGALLGGLLGYFLPSFGLALAFVGKLYISALHMLAIPLLIAGLIVAVTTLGNPSRVGKVGGRLAILCGVSTVAAALLALLLSVVFRPGMNVDTLAVGGLSPKMPEELLGFFGTPVPESLLGALLEPRLLGLIAFTVLVAIMLLRLRLRERRLQGVAEEVYGATLQLAYFALYLAPIAVFALCATFMSQQSVNLPQIGDYVSYLLVVTAGFLILGLLLFPLTLKLLGDKFESLHFSSVLPAAGVAFASSSTATALPLTQQSLYHTGTLDRRVVSLGLPISTMLQMAGTTLYIVIAAFFTAQAVGFSLSLFQILGIVVAAIILSIGTAGLPSAAIAVIPLLFAALGFPQEAFMLLSVLIVFDWLLDRIRAVINVWGDVLFVTAVSSSQEVQRTKPAFQRDFSDRRPDARPSWRSRGDKDERREARRLPMAAETGSPFEMSSTTAPALDIATGEPVGMSEESGRPFREGRPRQNGKRNYRDRSERRFSGSEGGRREDSGEPGGRGEGRRFDRRGRGRFDRGDRPTRERFPSHRSEEPRPAEESQIETVESELSEFDVPMPQETNHPTVSAEYTTRLGGIDETSAEDQEEAADVSFGRGRSRKGEKMRPNDLSGTTNLTSEEVTPGESLNFVDRYDTEGAEFGRTKRKKPLK